MIDPAWATRPIAEPALEKPLQLDDGRGAEGLLVGQLLNVLLALPCGEVTPRRGSLQVTCLEARSSLARTRLISSVEEVEETLPYSPATWKISYSINIPSNYRGLLIIRGWWFSGHPVQFNLQRFSMINGHVKMNRGMNGPNVPRSFYLLGAELS